MKSAKTTFIPITTFVGRGEGAVLILDPFFPPEHGHGNVENPYAKDAQAVADFLNSIFCIETMKELRKILP